MAGYKTRSAGLQLDVSMYTNCSSGSGSVPGSGIGSSRPGVVVSAPWSPGSGFLTVCDFSNHRIFSTDMLLLAGDKQSGLVIAGVS